jgi:hypothetical protein
MGALFRALLLLGFLIKFWWIILAVLVAGAAGVAVWVGAMHHSYELARRRRAQAAIAARADEQHAWVLAGDERGMYGDYAPKQTD